MAQTFGIPTRIRGSRNPITLDDIQRVAPSAFAVEPYQGMSSRYSYIPTSDVIRGMMAAGFQPFAAQQSRTAIEDRKAYTKHLIRFRHPDTAITVGGIHPEIVLINSHDGSSAYKLMAGLFRLVCGNGMIVADSMIESVSLRHSGNVIQEAAERSLGLISRMPETMDTVARWRGMLLTSGEKEAYATAAHAVRFADSDGVVDTPITPVQLLKARRVDDSGNDLWTVFNRVQENTLKGGLHGWKPGADRRTTTREVKGIDQDVRLNRALWTLTETMARLHSNGAQSAHVG